LNEENAVAKLNAMDRENDENCVPPEVLALYVCCYCCV